MSDLTEGTLSFEGVSSDEAVDGIAAAFTFLDEEGNAQGTSDHPQNRAEPDDTPTEAPTEAKAEAEESETVDETEGEDKGEDESAESTDENVEGSEEDDGESLQLDSLEELAGVLKKPVDEVLGEVKHTFKVNGQEVTASLQELTAGYQRQKDYDRSKTALGEERKEFRFQRQQALDTFNKNAAVMNALFTYEENQLIEAMQSDDLQRLRSEDEVQYLIKERELQNQLNAFQTRHSEFVQGYENAVEEQQTAFLQQETERLKSAGWTDKDLDLAVGGLVDLGYEPGELRRVADSRALYAVRRLQVAEGRVKQLEEWIANNKKVVTKAKQKTPKTLGKTASRNSKTGNNQLSKQQKLRRALMNRHANYEDMADGIATLLEG